MHRAIGGIAEILLAPNHIPTGVVTISGSAKKGSTLTIDASAINDSDNFAGYTPSYQYFWEVSSDNGASWRRLTSNDAADNNSSYTLTQQEVGKQIRAVVSYIDGHGTIETLYSAASSDIASNLTIHGSSIYTVVEGPSWGNAESNAARVGGHLATIGDKAEDDFVKSLAIGNDAGWIGLYDPTGTGAWEWSSSQASNYRNWSLGQPDYIGIEKWVGYHLTGQDVGKWGNAQSGPGMYNTAGIAEIPFLRRGDCAYVLVQGPTWEEAEANAARLGGHLVTINDGTENEWLVKSFGSSGLWSAWIGLSDRNTEGQREWASSELTAYENWYAASRIDFSVNDYSLIELQPNPLGEFGPVTAGQWFFANNNNTTNFIGQPRGIAEIKLAPNILPAGSPQLIGNPLVGSVLTIDTTQIRDPDNFDGYLPSYLYTWEVSIDGVS